MAMKAGSVALTIVSMVGIRAVLAVHLTRLSTLGKDNKKKMCQHTYTTSASC
ncbi:hypothetical protein E2C01_099167 [Portunus trituberculatus]|uniref:Uncharacterized protein n=1 Tax=Portunus trituberculatus TaxID=210409 RepID=A0A5B7K9M0_PORTR|nr:hypothetical protein [Portunus trituberculatus]